MRYSWLVLFTSFVFSPVFANSYKEIEKACEKEENYIICVRAFQGLPPFPSQGPLKSVPSVGPIAIKVIPYVEPINKKTDLQSRRKRLGKPWH